MKKVLTLFLGLVVVASYLISNSSRSNSSYQEVSPSVQLTPSPAVEATSEVNPIPKSLTPSSDLVLVSRVVDGDTIELETGQKLRYIGINTPETVDPRTSVQCFGKEASSKNKELVEGKRVRLEKDVSETDKFGRLLRYVYLEQNGQEIFVNNLLVKEGFAQVSTYPPDVKYQSLFLASQKEAQSRGLGLWSACGG